MPSSISPPGTRARTDSLSDNESLSGEEHQQQQEKSENSHHAAQGQPSPVGMKRRHFLLGASAVSAAAAVGCTARESSPAAEVRRWDRQTDVLIAGSGIAGIAAAIEARRAGAEVLLLEQLPILGGASAMSGGVSYLGGGTALQQALGFADTPEDMYRYIMGAGPKHPYADKVQLYCEESAAYFDWLVEQGVPFQSSFTDKKGLPFGKDSLYYSGNETVYPWNEIARPVPRGHKPGVPDHGGWKLMEVLIAAAERLGVEIQTQAGGERLVQESDGRVSGILAEWGGQKQLVRARRGVVLSCGGFVQNRDMVRLYAPELADLSTPWGSAGDMGLGILMGMGAGGTAVRMNQALITVPLYQPDNVLRGIVVNRYAQRFMPEDSYHCFLGDLAAQQQERQCYLITDADSSYAQPDHRVIPMGQADTIADIEQLVGFAPGALQGTVAYYNEHAVQGQDPLLRKEPKFVAPLVRPPFRAYDLNLVRGFCPHLTFGGLHTGLDGQVISVWGEEIPGLYAAGRTASGLPGSPYIASGISVGDGGFFGRRAGRHAAASRG